MMPHELRFHGIRDYEPTVIDFSGTGEHILIAGPNGSGKSTITFCMGAVLYSSKVDVEGLKSRNIQDDKTWNASIHFLFKNEGPTRIDAPLYIEFSVSIKQAPGSPIKRVFTISEGDDLEDLQKREVYRSGGQPNFGDYQQDLITKYRVYPDHYYLIWYQQEVNQFAIMSPEERFRVFSEMHGISNIQKSWETSLEHVKDIRSSVVEAETSVNNDRLQMSDAKNMYDRLVAHQKSIHENGQTIVQTLLALNKLYQDELKTTEGTIETLTNDREDLIDQMVTLEKDLADRKNHLKHTTQLTEDLSAKITNKNELLTSKQEELEVLRASMNELSDQLKEVEEKGKWLRYSEEKTLKYYQDYQKQLHKHEGTLVIYSQKIEELDQEKVTLYERRAHLKSEISSYHKQLAIYQDLLDQYTSRHHVQTRINLLETEISNKNQLKFQIKEQKSEAEAELAALEKNQVVSKRQQESIRQMIRMGINVYPLQSLIELQENAPIEAEKQLDAIKYTIFYDSKEIDPVNDLYHVSLMDIIPQQFINQISELKLQVKKGLTSKEQTFATKALWWIKQFISEEQPHIREGRLVDTRGVRGTQEHQTYILSEKALTLRKTELTKLITKQNKQLEKYENELTQLTEEIQSLHGVITQVAEAEAFQLQRHQHLRNKEKLEKHEERLKAIDIEQAKLESNQDGIRNEMASVKLHLENLASDLEVYKELGELTAQFEKFSQIKARFHQVTSHVQHLQETITKLENDFYQKENQADKAKRSVSRIKNNIGDANREIYDIGKQIESKSEEKDILQADIIKNEKELMEMKEHFQEVYQSAVMEKEPLEGQSQVSLKNDYFNGRRAFDLTRQETGINYEAGNIYEKAKENYEEKSAELSRLKILLEENKARAEENEQNLITTIQMKVLQINHLFQNYMTHFQFECGISFDKYEEKHGRVIFRLFIKVRKQGHRGKMEDVSLKARAGKVGKGVSGGEESLSSLLFALALLQELDINPSFIVLDEFDSALDEGRKEKVFDLYAEQLNRKLIIISPKGHENEYLDNFSKAYIARHDPTLLKSTLVGVNRKAS